MQNLPARVNQLTEICDNPKPDDSSHRFFAVWGFNTEDLYKIALKFFKDKDGSKALQITYKDRLHLIALSKQVAFGRFQPRSAPDLGLFDVVGNDRRLAWQKLGDMPKDSAMCEFISSLNNLCPLFAPYVTAHKVEKEEQERKKREAEEEINRMKRLEMEEEEMRLDEERRRQKTQEMMIRNALNQQTAVQFRTYAEQHFPGNKAEQENLITQLQEQHFAQYMMQVYNQQSWSMPPASSSQQIAPMPPSPSSTSSSSVPPTHSSTPASSSHQPSSNTHSQLPTTSPSEHSGFSNDLGLPNGLHSSDGNKNIIMEPNHVNSESALEKRPDKRPDIEAASLWTRRDVKQFKESLRGEPDSSIRVGSGETVTVRIPTHEDGSCLFWEFATEGYDIGFGVSFEWSDTPSSQLTVEVTSSDFLEDKSEPQWQKTPPSDVIIPVYRRDSHSEVYCGSHVYPGNGVYLFVFDNSYSLWRSKTIFYRVYYTR